MSKIVSAKKTNVIFLAVVLVVGTFVLLSPFLYDRSRSCPRLLNG